MEPIKITSIDGWDLWVTIPAKIQTCCCWIQSFSSSSLSCNLNSQSLNSNIKLVNSNIQLLNSNVPFGNQPLNSTIQTFHLKKPALQNKQVVVFRMAFRVQKVFGTFEKRAPGLALNKRLKVIRKWPCDLKRATFLNQGRKPQVNI